MARGGLSAVRATEIIDFLAARGTTAFSLSELARELQINVASCHAILLALTKSGHLSRHPKHKTYTLGPALVAIGHVALRNHDLISRAEAAAAELSRTLGVEVLLSMRAGESVLGIAHFQVERVSRSLLRTGQRLPLQVPYGATFVAWENEKDIERWITQRPGSKVDPEQAAELRTLLRLIRERGYQISLMLDERTDPKALGAQWERGSYVEQAADRMHRVHGHLDLLFFDLLEDSGTETYAVEFITVPLFDPHDRALYAMTMYNFEQRMTAREIQARLSRLLSMCASLARES